MIDFLLIAGAFGISAIVRSIIGCPIRKPQGENLLFEATWVTGYPAWSHGFIVVGSNCMWVQVTADKVTVRTHFPISIFLVPEVFDIGWEFPREKLISCSKTVLGVRVQYQGRYRKKEFVVHLGDKDGFLQAISNAQQGSVSQR